MREKGAWSREWADMRRQEDAFLERYRQAQAPLEQLRDRVPQGVQDTLEAAFSKAFCVILEKGTPAIEKTLRKEELKRRAALWAFDVSQKETRRALREPGKKARASALRDTAFSGAQGLVLGVLGMGLPDVPLFVGEILRGVYKTALHYGFSYEGEAEQMFVLAIVEAACSAGEAQQERDRELNRLIETGRAPASWTKKGRREAAAAALAGQVLYLKFLQGVPVAGAVGGAYNAPVLRRVLRYAGLKYRRRFLRGLRREKPKG